MNCERIYFIALLFRLLHSLQWLRMMPYRSRSGNCFRLLPFIVLAVALLVAAGCGGGSPLVPLVKVSGIVKLGGAPMPMGTVEYHPDGGKGNTFKGTPRGMITPDGSYSLVTDGREGAPVGWYLVTITGQGMPDPSKMTEPGKMPTPPAVNPKYARPGTSGFSVEVKDGAPAGVYDLSLIK
jgi:hypothetical protein